MSPLLDTLAAFFAADDWPFMQVDELDSLRTRFRGEHGEWKCYALARDAEQLVLFYAICPVTVPEEQRTLMAELLTRANAGLAFGNFELDFEDGEIRYKTSIDTEANGLTPARIKNLVYANVLIADRYLPSVMAVLYENVAPAQAIVQVESGSPGVWND